MELVREILRLKFEYDHSNRQIAKVVSKTKDTIGLYIGRALASGINSIEILNSISDEELKETIFPNTPQKRSQIKVDFEWVNKELKKKHTTRLLIWQELLANNPKLYHYSYFCDLYRAWSKSKGLSMRIEYKAGEKLFIDYAGPKVPIIINKKTGEINEAVIFVCSLGASQYTYVEASWSQGTSDFISSSISAFEYYGGTPEILVPDNLKAGVNQACKYEPVINRSYREMATHYGTVVIPARPYKPKDKAIVENSVLIAERWILAALRNRTFFSLDELNEAIWELLEKYNNRPFQKIAGCRKSLFDEIEKDALNPLPASRYVVAEWKKVKLNIDYHIQLENCFYSAPYKLRGDYLECRYTASTVEIFSKGTRVASHLRSYKRGNTTTNSEHMPRSHREHLEWSPSRMLSWGKSIGNFTGQVFEKLMERVKHPELAYKSCLGITRLEKTYGKDRLEKACERAIRLSAISYKSIKSILEKNLDGQQVQNKQIEFALEHENIRGANYYQ